MYVTLDHVEQHAQSIATYWFKPQRPLRYIAGQFVELYLPHDNADSRGQKRWFTLSSSPSEQLISITTRHAVQHGGTFKQALGALQPGTQVLLSDPLGDFVLPKDTTIPLVFIAGGIGITPMRSMTKWLHDRNETRPISLIYGANTITELLDAPLFQKQYGAAFTPVLTQPPADWDGQVGRLAAKDILAKIDPSPRTLYFLSGPEPMIKALIHDLQDQGIAKHQIVMDYFPGYTAQ
jgi:ferredoxin-NADP reductase